jgi:small subunit ribosomal protein S21
MHHYLKLHDLGESSLEIVPAPDETFEATLRRFKRTVAQSGILREAKRREHHMSTRDKKRMKSAEAAKKRRRRQ